MYLHYVRLFMCNSDSVYFGSLSKEKRPGFFQLNRVDLNLSADKFEILTGKPGIWTGKFKVTTGKSRNWTGKFEIPAGTSRNPTCKERIR